MKIFGVYVETKDSAHELEKVKERCAILEAENAKLKMDGMQWRTEEDEKEFARLNRQIVRLDDNIVRGRQQLNEVTALLDAEKEYSNRLFRTLRGFRVSDITRRY